MHARLQSQMEPLSTFIKLNTNLEVTAVRHQQCLALHIAGIVPLCVAASFLRHMQERGAATRPRTLH